MNAEKRKSFGMEPTQMGLPVLEESTPPLMARMWKDPNLVAMASHLDVEFLKARTVFRNWKKNEQ